MKSLCENMFCYKCCVAVFCFITLINDVVTSTSFEVHAVVGEPLQLSCSRHRPSDAIHWLHDGKPVRLTHRITTAEEQLKISRVLSSDAGEYLCIVGGDENASVTVTVQDLERPSVVLEHPSSTSDLQEGADLGLICTSPSKSDDIAFHWYRNGVKLTKGPRIDLKRGNLRVKKLSDKDNGIYCCTVHVRGRTEDSVNSFALAIPAAKTPLLKTAPQHQVVHVGGTARFECIFGDAHTVWYGLDEIKPMQSDQRISTQDGVLMIEKVTYADEGIYTCAATASQDGRPVATYAAKLTVARLHQMSEASFDPPLPDSHTVYAHQTHYLEVACLRNRHDKPRPDVVWRFGGNKVNNQSSIKIEDDTLIIKSLDNQHGGLYMCDLSNMAANHTLSFYLVVIPRPKFLNPPKLLESSSDHAPHTCQFSSRRLWPIDAAILDFWNTTLQIQISKKHKHAAVTSHKMAARHNGLDGGGSKKQDRKRMSEILYLEYKSRGVDAWNNASDEFIASTLKRIDSSLKVSDYVKLEEEEEVYWCRSLWSAKPSSRTMRAAAPDQLKFTPEPVNKRLTYNITGKIVCKASGNPQPNITWFRNANEPLPSEATSTNGTLTFSPSLREHKGNYTCVASNINESINVTILVDVGVPPRIIWPEQDLTVRAAIGDDVRLNCRVDGDPQPTIHWDKNLQLLQANGGYGNETERIQIFPNGTLYIRDVRIEDSDKYSCTAGSSAGLARHDLLLVVGQDDGSFTSKEDSGVGNTAVIVSVCVAAAYMILALALMYYCRRRRSGNDKVETNELEAKCEDRDKLMEGGEVEADGVKSAKNKSNGRLKAKNGNLKKSDGDNTTGGESAAAKSDNSAGSKRTGQVTSQYDKLSISRTLLSDCVTLGRGEYGDIILAKLDYGKLKGAERDSNLRPVMVKSLLVREQAECMEFKRQLDLFHKVRSDHLTAVVGLCNDLEPHYLVFEYSDWGDFKQYLQSTQTDEELEAYRQKCGAKLGGEIVPCKRKSAASLSDEENLALVHQLARGAAAIAVNRFVHKDIAARNCIISSNLHLKLSIPAMSKTAYAHEYFKLNARVIPLRWSPSEILGEEDYSSKSDVYMFAVTVWEIYNKGELPFARSNDTTVLNHIKNDTLKWQHHPRTPACIQDLINRCLSQNPRNRPNFEDIVREIDGFVMCKDNVV